MKACAIFGTSLLNQIHGSLHKPQNDSQSDDKHDYFDNRVQATGDDEREDENETSFFACGAKSKHRHSHPKKDESNNDDCQVFLFRYAASSSPS